jgi:hypothetical protein
MAKAYSVPARLVKGRTGYLWVIDRCPHCHKRHEHGGGGLAEDPRRYLGQQAAHCARPPRAGYELSEAPAERMPWWAR